MECTRVATLLLLTLIKYFAISYSQQNIVDYTWVTSLDGNLTYSNIYCSNCEVICDVSYGCDGSNFYCKTGDCSLKCTAENACYYAATYDTHQTKLFDISCTARDSCPKKIHWTYPQSMVEQVTEKYSNDGNYVEIEGPNDQGELKPWNQNCKGYGSCSNMEYSLSQANISLICKETGSCFIWNIDKLSKSVVSIESHDSGASWIIDDGGSGIFQNNKVTVQGQFYLRWLCYQTNNCMDNSITMYDSSSVGIYCNTVESCVNITIAIHDSSVVSWNCNENKACVNNTVLVYDHRAHVDWDCITPLACENCTVIHMG